VGFIQYLTKARVPLVEYDLPKLINIQAQLEKLIASNYYLNRTAKEGFRSYLAAYAAHSLRSVFDVHKVDLAATAKSFGFSVPPKVDIALGAHMAKDKRPTKRRAYGSQPRQLST
jgi:ATP-dependent RNA helicase DDX18/HAS1